MIPYYKQLEHPNDCKIILGDTKTPRINSVKVLDYLPVSYFKEHEYLFRRLNLIDSIISCVTVFPTITYEEVESKFELLNPETGYPNEDGEDKFYLTTNSYEVDKYLSSYYLKIHNLIKLYPNKEKELGKIRTEIEKARSNINKVCNIKIAISEESKYRDYYFPNSWYITPSNYLYNDLGVYGHKEGNLVYPIWEIIEHFQNDTEFEEHDNTAKIKQIIHDRCVPYYLFHNYTNVYDRFINIHTPQSEVEDLKRISLKKDVEELEATTGRKIKWEEYTTLCKKYDFKDPMFNSLSYQLKTCELVIGFLKARDDLYNSMLVFNESKRKDYILKRIGELFIKDSVFTLNDTPDRSDFLVRLCGFSKVSSILPKTIVTSRIAIYDDFIEYLNRGWKIQLIPPITYNKKEDDLTVINTDYGIVGNYLEENEIKYPQFKKQIIR